MRAISGFMLTEVVDPETKKFNMVPYFPFVRPQDIIITDTVDIRQALNKMSRRWTSEEIINSIEYTKYIFSAKYSNLTSDKTGEPIGSSFLDAKVSYILYKDGRLDVEGTIRLNGNSVDLVSDRIMAIKEFYLPYSIPEPSIVKTELAFGAVSSVTTMAGIEAIQNTCTKLNEGLEDTKTYFDKMNLRVICPKDDSDTNELKMAYLLADKKYSNSNYLNYINSFIPIKFEINDLKWK